MRPDPILDLTLRAERDSAWIASILHACAAIAVGFVFWDVDTVPRWSLTAFVAFEALLSAMALSSYALARSGRHRQFRRIDLAQTSLTAVSFAALAWLMPDLAGMTPGKYLLMITLVSVTAVIASSSSTLIRRRRSLVQLLAVMGTSHVVAYVVNGEVLFASLAVVFCVAMVLFSRVGFDAVQELIELRRLSENAARHDDLTGLLNRAAFIDELEHRAKIDSGDVLALLDLDGFKAINDSYGHAMGDVVLNAVASHLRNALPPGSALARLGGDEFAALVPMGEIDLRLTLERLVEGLAEAIPVEGADVYVAGSMGWTDLRRDANAPELMAEADAAMYASKNSATTSSTGFSPALRVELERSLELRQHFRNAVRGGRIDFRAQPIVSAADGRPLAVELLARWPADAVVEIGPDAFNQLADQTGLAVELDRLALSHAAKLLAAWRHDNHLADLVVKVNVSPIHLDNLRLARSIRELIPDGDRHRLGLEFVESKLVIATKPGHALLRELVAMGVTISIDDFGTGYSSLAYLQSMPVSEIKIDRAFVTGIESDRVNQALVKAIVDLASALGFATVAEGVEQECELAMVRELGVTAIQGFLTGRPVGFDEVGVVLRDRREALRQRPGGDLDPV